MKKTGFWVLMMVATFLVSGCRQEAVATGNLWTEDYDAALAQAAAENKYVLVDFSGSDWCGWCIRLDKEVFSQGEFIDYAKENLILVLLDFPNSKPQTEALRVKNQMLSEKYGIQGFPTVLILDPQGKVAKRTGYQQGGPTAYVDMIRGVIGK
ncbi:MAG: thioredoxin family protein [Verrucomicrobia bacterium]|nr:thioredoxin family protein [Verrucomicrobiota bacterium]